MESMSRSDIDSAVHDIVVLLKYTVTTGRLHGEGHEPWSVLGDSFEPIDVFVCVNCPTEEVVTIATSIVTLELKKTWI